MPIDFTCPNCRHRSIVADQFAGQSGPCAQCGQTIKIPVPGQVLGGQGQPIQQARPAARPAAPAQPAAPANPYANPMGPHGTQPDQFGAAPGNFGSAPGQFGVPPRPGQSDAGMRMLIPVDRSPLAIIAGYLGLFAVLCVPAPIALVLGILAIRDIKKNPKKHGLGRAWFAVISGGLFTLIMVVMMIAAMFG